MAEPSGAALPPAPPPQKVNPWIIAIVVIVVLCCFCIGVIGLLSAFGGPILHELGILQARLCGVGM
jgi:hypothetical protein